ncbi:amidase [Nereida sp. MMG025]|uniref:amidase n=1 Tax=Nereida sp. MMG025 TaxID=2909981 RepID=UPI001EED62CE|nr:amidase family protein [Nereida sp. MMG025]MCF6444804.1 amidase [Nereida sp. MMG025]
MHQWQKMTAVELGVGIARGEIDPMALCDVFLAAIEAHEFADRIYARQTPDRARSEAAAAQRRAKEGRRLSPLDGVPVSWKDLFDSAGVATEAGSRLLEGRVPAADAEVLHHATAMGLVCLGKTHLSELAFSGLGYNPMTASAPCVNDVAAVAGGSSSGAAASVAFGLAAGAIGSDTGGSVRIPACWNDLVGFKTTHGQVSLGGVVDLCARFDTVGPLARTVEDAAALYAVMGGSTVDLRGASLKGMRFGALQTIVLDDLEEAPRNAYAQAIATLEAAGVQVIAFDAPELRGPFEDAVTLYTAEAYGRWHQMIEAAPHKMFDNVRARFEQGKDVAASDYVAAWQRLDVARALWAETIAGFDAVIMPSAPIMPPNLARLESDTAYFKHANLMTLRNTRVGNLMGGCAITLPTGVPSTGIMLNAAANHDARLLRVAAAAERVLA